MDGILFLLFHSELSHNTTDKFFISFSFFWNRGVLYYTVYLYDLSTFDVLKLNIDVQFRIERAVTAELVDAAYVHFFPNKSNSWDNLGELSTEHL